MKRTPGFPSAKRWLRRGCGWICKCPREWGALPPASWHRPLFAVPEHRLEMADAMGSASRSPRQGIICPVILGQRIPPQLCLEEGGGQEGRLRIPQQAPRPTPRHPCLTWNSAERQGWAVCRTVLFPSSLPNVENLPGVPDTRAAGCPRGVRLVGAVNRACLLLSVGAPGSPWTVPSADHCEACLPACLGG